MAKSVLTSWCGFEAQHRWEDLPVIADTVLRPLRPDVAIELGTARGGFAAFLASTLLAWEGRVLTLDHVTHAHPVAPQDFFPNLTFQQADVLTEPSPFVLDALRSARCPLLYCDNGNKMRELDLYSPFLPVGGLLGCHDYQDEVDPAIIEPLLAVRGYAPFHHEVFSALAHPTDYPVSLSRFWRREFLGYGGST